MRHRVHHSRLGKGIVRRRGMLSQLARVMIARGSVTTTIGRAKQLRPFIEPLVTKARTSSIATRRYLIRRLNNEETVKRLLEVIGPRYRSRPGGYTSIVRIGKRLGDRAERANISFVTENVHEQKGK